MTIITRLDPLTYGVDALRTILSGIPSFALSTDLALLCGIAVAFLSLGAYLFSKIQL
jgi:ABC-2 type transport system permease protein